MKKITRKMKIYTTNFILKNIIFNLGLIFSIVSLVHVKQGYTYWATIAIALAGLWVFLNLLSHFIWYKMDTGERALWLAIRRHGKEIINITSKDISKTGQKDMVGILSDADSGLEIQMLINGTGTIVNLFIGIKWIINARRFNNHKNEFTYHLQK